MENIGEDVRRRKWNFIGHIMRKGYDNDCMATMTWAQKGARGGVDEMVVAISSSESTKAEYFFYFHY